MDCVGRFNTNFGTSTKLCFFINVSCVLACCAKHGQNTSNHTVVPKLSSHTPMKIIKKIYKAIIPYMCMKTKQQEELSPHISKNLMKKINKALPYMCLEIKQQQEDDKCLWKKTIMMGEKCQPLQFSGAIFYDCKGNQLSEPPRSPRASPSLLPALEKRVGMEM